MSARISAFLVWALVSATLLFWALRLIVRSPPTPVYAVAVDDSAAVRGDLTRLLGSAPVSATAPAAAAAPEAARFKLLGIMAPRARAAVPQGVALIAVDGKPARAYTVGTSLDDQLVLQSVSLRTAAIGPAGGPSAVVLEMPQLPTAATGTLPTYGGTGGNVGSGGAVGNGGNGGVPVPAARFAPPSGNPPLNFPPSGQPVPQTYPPPGSPMPGSTN